MSKESLLRAFMEEIWNKKNVEKVAEYVHPEYEIFLDINDPWEGKVLSHEEFINRLHYSFDSFPDIHFEITFAIEEEEHVAINWIMTGTNLGNIGALAPTNRGIKTNGITIYHFKNGLVSGHTQIFDRTAVMRQLGYIAV